MPQGSVTTFLRWRNKVSGSHLCNNYYNIFATLRMYVYFVNPFNAACAVQGLESNVFLKMSNICDCMLMVNCRIEIV